MKRSVPFFTSPSASFLYSLLSIICAPRALPPYLSGIATYEVFHHLYLLCIFIQKKTDAAFYEASVFYLFDYQYHGI